ncbi:hypothetical protein FRC02_001508 [Tulasnella sp. 418]|nr:hypothetical protein FRC02_001508 [Tulasnella sp. 418]
MKNGNTNLLVLDPARPIDQHTRKAALAHHNRTKQNAASISPSSMPSKSASTSAVAPTTHKKITTTVKSAVHSLSNRSPLKRVQEKLNGEKRQYIDVDADELDEASNNKRMRGGIKPRSSNEVIDVDIIDVDDVEESPTTKATSASANIKGKGKDYGTPSFTKSIPQSPTTKTAPPSDDLDHLKFVKMFRVDAKKLSKNNQYQLLWLPLSAPLTEAEKIQGKTVISEQIIV